MAYRINIFKFFPKNVVFHIFCALQPLRSFGSLVDDQFPEGSEPILRDANYEVLRKAVKSKGIVGDEVFDPVNLFLKLGVDSPRVFTSEALGMTAPGYLSPRLWG